MDATTLFVSANPSASAGIGCLERGDRPGRPQRRAGVDDDEATQRPGALYCARCGYVVTAERDRIDVSGAHEHTFVNPAGVVFRIGCFEDAPGCGPQGPPSSFFSWFPGYAWQIAACRDCHTHLGWSFGEAPDFYGLILDRLASEP